MIKYLKFDEYYKDQYDRLTIETLKECEAELIEKFKDCQDYAKVTSAQITLFFDVHWGQLEMKFSQWKTAVQFY